MTEQGGPDPNAPGWGPPPGYGVPQQGWHAPPPGYGGGYPAPPPGAYYGAPPTDGKAVGALVSSILAWFVCPVVAAIVALVLAGMSSREIRASGGQLQGEGFNTAARIVAWLNIALVVLVLGFVLAMGLIVQESFDSAPSQTEFSGCRGVTVDARRVPC